MNLRALAFATCLAVPAPAFAGGYALPIHGVRALGVGGALVAGAEGTDALWYNPSRMDGSSVGLEVGVIAMDVAFTDPSGARAENGATPLPNPGIGAVWHVSDLLSLGLAAYAPWSGQLAFPETGPTRYSLVENNKTKVLFVHLGAAFRIGNLKFGGGVQNVIGNIKQRFVLSGYTGLFGQPTDADLDILSEIDLNDPVTITGNFGASYDLGPVTFGFSGQLPFSISGEATFRNRLGSSVFFDPISVEGDKAELAIPFPLVLRAGLQWRAMERLTVEGAFTWEDWSTQQRLITDSTGKITLHGVPGIGDWAMKQIILERRMHDTFSIHFGADGEVYESLHVRGGFFYEPSAFDDETFSVAVFDPSKVGVSFGASWSVSSLRFDLAAAHIFSGDRRVDSSVMTQINPTNPNQAAVVANGTYESGTWIAAVGVSYLFDDVTPPPKKR